ncbi:hypothetical protein MRB53_037888 [Persea americana]|nr:hypothetical protein MRB53_037888 [Persea americana]
MVSPASIRRPNVSLGLTEEELTRLVRVDVFPRNALLLLNLLLQVLLPLAQHLQRRAQVEYGVLRRVLLLARGAASAAAAAAAEPAHAPAGHGRCCGDEGAGVLVSDLCFLRRSRGEKGVAYLRRLKHLSSSTVHAVTRGSPPTRDLLHFQMMLRRIAEAGKL